MKKTIIFMLAAIMHVCMFAQDLRFEHTDVPLWQRANKVCKVKGGAGIVQFVDAIFGCKNGAFSTDPIIDKKNGYYSCGEEGDGGYYYNVCYWNRKDGKKLVIMSYKEDVWDAYKPSNSSVWGHFESHITTGGKEESCMNLETGFCAYLYNEQKSQLEPLATPPFNNWRDEQSTNAYLILPQKGKDIKVTETIDFTEISHILKWNGSTFDFVRSENAACELYVADGSSTATNIRNAPGGAIVDKLPMEGEFTVIFDRIENGWCHIVGNTVLEEMDNKEYTLKGSANGYWIHSSVLEGKGMGDGRVTLYAEPDETSEVVVSTDDYTPFTPVKIQGIWLKVRTVESKKEGWIKINAVCSSPLTNCC